MEKSSKYKINMPLWPIINLKTLISLSKAYLRRYWSWYGKNEIEFIQKFAKIQTSKYVITTTSATIGMENALIACGIKQGDEVIIPAYTWIATATAVARIGAIPVIVDINPETLCISVSAIKQAITERTKAIIPVHLASALCDMKEIMQIAKEHNLKVIEDCAHSHGATYENRGTGSIGDVGVFSFQHAKLMCSGEGGACTVQNIKIADNIDKLTHIGYSMYLRVPKAPLGMICSKHIMTEFQLALLNNQCDVLLKQTAKRIENAKYLEELLQNVDGIRIQQTPKETTRRSYYFFVFMIDSNRLKENVSKYTIIEELRKCGLRASNGWGIPVYKHEAWNLRPEQYVRHDTSITERISEKEVIALPQMLFLTNKKNIKKVAELIINTLEKYII